MVEQCATCRYSTPLDSKLYCRRYPPTATTMAVVRGMRQTLQGPSPDLVFPTGSAIPEVAAHAWCGEWQVGKLDG